MSKKNLNNPVLVLLYGICLALILGACSRSAAPLVLFTRNQPQATLTSEALAVQPTSSLFAEPVQPTETATALPTDPPPAATEVVQNSIAPTATSTQIPLVPTATPFPTAIRLTSYTLQKDEYPYCIARRLNVDPGELLRLNHLAGVGEVYYSGQVLQIPQSGNPFPGSRGLLAHTAYVVQSQDTLNHIACAIGDISPEDIARVNGLSAPYTLSVGQVLSLQAKADAAPQASQPATTVPVVTLAAPDAALVIVESTATTAPTVLPATATPPQIISATPLPALAVQNTVAAPTLTGTPTETRVSPSATALPTLTETATATAEPTLAPSITVAPDTATPLPSETVQPTETALPAAETNPSELSPSPTVTPLVQTSANTNWFVALLQRMGDWIRKTLGYPAATADAVTQAAAAPTTAAPTEEIPFPTPIPPTETAVPVLKFEASTDQNAVPQGLNQELYFAGLGGGGGRYCDFSMGTTPPSYPDVLISMISDDYGDAINTGYLNSNIFISTCGWDAGDQLSASVTYPSGKLLTITPEMEGGTDGLGYISKFQFNLGLSDPEGQYSVTVTASGGRHAQAAFTMEAVDSPRLRYLSSQGNIDHYMLYGFNPGERVLLSKYKSSGHLILNGWEYITVDANGKKLIDLQVEKPSFFVLGDFFLMLNSDAVVLFAQGDISGKAKFVSFQPISDQPQ